MNETDVSILDDIYRGLRKLEEQPKSSHRLADVQVVLLDDDNVIIGKFSVSSALDILANDLHNVGDGIDVRGRASAEVWPSIDTRSAGSRAKDPDAEWQAAVNKLSRDACVRILRNLSFHTDDDETVDVLREAVAQSVRDGDVDEGDLVEDAPIRHSDGPPWDAATRTGMYDRDF